METFVFCITSIGTYDLWLDGFTIGKTYLGEIEVQETVETVAEERVPISGTAGTRRYQSCHLNH